MNSNRFNREEVGGGGGGEEQAEKEGIRMTRKWSRASE